MRVPGHHEVDFVRDAIGHAQIERILRIAGLEGAVVGKPVHQRSPQRLRLGTKPGETGEQIEAASENLQILVCRNVAVTCCSRSLRVEQ